MKKKRKNDFIQLAVLVLLGLSVILSIILPQVTRQPKEPQILSVSILIRDTDSSLWTNTRLGMDQAADELGAELRFLTLTTPDDAAEQGELLRREMENGADAAVIVPADPDAIASVLSSSAEVCPIVSMESPVEGASGTIFADPVQLGTELAQALLADWTPAAASTTASLRGSKPPARFWKTPVCRLPNGHARAPVCPPACAAFWPKRAASG